MNAFEYANPVRVHFGENTVKQSLAAELKNTGKTILLAYGGGSVKRNGVYDDVTAVLREAGKEVVEFGGIMPNPTYTKVQEGAKLVRDHKIDFILAVGGGSVMDCCKMVSAQACLDEDIWEFELDKGLYPEHFVPMGAVVTAFGTGAELNRLAVITHEKRKIKLDMFGTFYDFAIIDPAYTMTMPFKQVLSGAFDSLSHAMEINMGSPREMTLSDELSMATQKNIIRNMRALIADPEDKFARSELIWASEIAENGILKIGKVTDFECHMLQHQLGAYTDTNHGQGLAVLHPILYRHMLPEAAPQFARYAVHVWDIDPAGKTELELAEEFIDALAAFVKETGLPTTLKEMGITEETDLYAIAESTIRSAGCCKEFTTEELYEVLKESL